MITIVNEIRAIVKKQLGEGAPGVPDDASLRDDFWLDSLDMLDIALSIEERFNVDIPADKASRLLTIRDFAAFVARALGKTPAAIGA